MRHDPNKKRILFILSLCFLLWMNHAMICLAGQNKKIIYPVFQAKNIVIDCNFKDWDLSKKIILEQLLIGNGAVLDPDDLSGTLCFLWDQDYLYIAAKITDNEIVADLENEKIWMNDCIEIYIDPDNNGLIWKSPKDFQFGFSPSFKNKIGIWEWFHTDRVYDIMAKCQLNKNKGYIIEAGIPWKDITIVPKKGFTFGLGICLNDIDRESDDTPESRLIWGYCKQGGVIQLANMVLK